MTCGEVWGRNGRWVLGWELGFYFLEFLWTVRFKHNTGLEWEAGGREPSEVEVCTGEKRTKKKKSKGV